MLHEWITCLQHHLVQQLRVRCNTLVLLRTNTTSLCSGLLVFALFFYWYAHLAIAMLVRHHLECEIRVERVEFAFEARHLTQLIFDGAIVADDARLRQYARKTCPRILQHTAVGVTSGCSKAIGAA